MTSLGTLVGRPTEPRMGGWTGGWKGRWMDGQTEFLPILQDFVSAALLLPETSKYQRSRAREPLTSWCLLATGIRPLISLSQFVSPSICQSVGLETPSSIHIIPWISGLLMSSNITPSRYHDRRRSDPNNYHQHHHHASIIFPLTLAKISSFFYTSSNFTKKISSFFLSLSSLLLFFSLQSLAPSLLSSIW